MHRVVVLVFLGCWLGGCAPSSRVVQESGTNPQETIDSLQTVNDSLHSQLVTLRDSMQFYDDIFSGQYYRDRRRLLSRIDRLRYYVSLYRDGGTTVRTLLADDLFEPASATLTTAGKERVAQVAEVLQQKYPERAFRIEGYTDNVPVGPSLREKYPSNWELSAARASAVLRELINAHDLQADRFSVVGYGPLHPQAENDTRAGRRQNRRVRIAVLPEESG